MMVALSILWPFLMAAWRWEFGRCTILPRWSICGVTVTERVQMVALLGVLALPGWHILGPVFWSVLWGALALYWTRGHNWESASALLYRYGPAGLIYRAAFRWWPAKWCDGRYIDGPESVARIGVGFCCGAVIGSMWLG